MNELRNNKPRYPNFNRAILFIVPSLMITVSSIILFSQLTGLTQQQNNIFSITIIAAIILSLLGTAGMQVLIYRVVDDDDYYIDGGAVRGTIIGIVYSVIFSLFAAVLVAPYFLIVINFSFVEYLYFVYLLFLYSAIWVIVSVFWAANQHKYPAIIFTFSYLFIFLSTFISYHINSEYTITGYTIGTTVLLMLCGIISILVFRKPKAPHKLINDFIRLKAIIPKNLSSIMFNILYVLAIFLDKIIVWLAQGLSTGQGIVVTGNYTQGSFMGLVPMFSIAMMAYFTSRTKPLTTNRYEGTFLEIKNRISQYKKIYQFSFGMLLLMALGLAVIISLIFFLLNLDAGVMKILITVAIGAIFFSGVMFNSVVLSIFGKNRISTLAVLCIVFCELASIPLVTNDIWFSAMGFTIGSFIGFLISYISTFRLFSNYEYNMFSYLLKT